MKRSAKSKVQAGHGAKAPSPGKNMKNAAGKKPVTNTVATVVPPVRSSNVDKNTQPENADRNVDQIRDILFGGQMRDYERRFQEMVQRLDQETLRLREDFERRSGAIEKRLDEHLDKLLKQMRQEVNDRGQALDDLESRVQQAARSARSEVNSAVAALQQDIGAGDERLRNAVVELNAALKQVGDHASAVLVAARDELRTEKVSRDDLAAMFTEVALRLKGNFDLPVPR